MMLAIFFLFRLRLEVAYESFWNGGLDKVPAEGRVVGPLGWFCLELRLFNEQTSSHQRGHFANRKMFLPQ